MVLCKKLLLVGSIVFVAMAVSANESVGDQAADKKEWTVPEGAALERNPVAATPEVLKSGQQIYESKCRGCHGVDGAGKGSQSDPLRPAGNLTDRLRASFNPDGVMFYKVWNGREKPRMPAFKADGMSKEDVWTVVTYVKSLRK